MPVASERRLAARPVGAHSRHRTILARRMSRLALTRVVLPTPVPPVMPSGWLSNLPPLSLYVSQMPEALLAGLRFRSEALNYGPCAGLVVSTTALGRNDYLGLQPFAVQDHLPAHHLAATGPEKPRVPEVTGLRTWT
jgi:hypothetical protein